MSDHSLVDLPAGLPAETLRRLGTARIGSRQLRISPGIRSARPGGSPSRGTEPRRRAQRSGSHQPGHQGRPRQEAAAQEDPLELPATARNCRSQLMKKPAPTRDWARAPAKSGVRRCSVRGPAVRCPRRNALLASGVDSPIRMPVAQLDLDLGCREGRVFSCPSPVNVLLFRRRAATATLLVPLAEPAPDDQGTLRVASAVNGPFTALNAVNGPFTAKAVTTTSPKTASSASRSVDPGPASNKALRAPGRRDVGKREWPPVKLSSPSTRLCRALRDRVGGGFDAARA